MSVNFAYNAKKKFWNTHYSPRAIHLKCKCEVVVLAPVGQTRGERYYRLGIDSRILALFGKYCIS